MGEFIKWVIIIIVGFAILGFIFSKDGEREDNAKLGATIGGGLIVSLLPTIIVIFFVVLLVRACT